MNQDPPDPMPQDQTASPEGMGPTGEEGLPGGIVVEDLGRMPLEPVLDRMRELVDGIRRGSERGRVLLVEHDPVFTAGRATEAEDIAAAGAIPVERGGRITWHGPGQLVIYPVVPLPKRDVRDWLRRLEAFGVAVCGAFGLGAEPSVDGTGVFVGGRKVASIGVAIRHWISFHGIAINGSVAREPWFQVKPCGLEPDIMSDLSTVLGRTVPLAELAAAACAALPALLRGPTNDSR